MVVLRVTPEFLEDAYAFWGYTPEIFRQQLIQLTGKQSRVDIIDWLYEPNPLDEGDEEVTLHITDSGVISLRKKETDGTR
jgi:hypothetical protein